jgi:hypothetical protein
LKGRQTFTVSAIEKRKHLKPTADVFLLALLRPPIDDDAIKFFSSVKLV